MATGASMRRWKYSSGLAASFDQFVALKRACGAAYESQGQSLAQFDRYLQERRCRTVDAAVVLGFVDSVKHLAPRTRANLFSVVWRALEHARRHGGRVARLPPRPVLKLSPHIRPYVLSEVELDRLLHAAARGPWRGPLCRVTYATIFGLFCVTGLRLSEMIALDIADLDVDQCTLLVRAGKFRKTRLVPLSRSTVEGLQKYLRRRIRSRALLPSSPLFVSQTGGRFAAGGIDVAFRKIVKRAHIRDAAGRRPRLHDLRHTFAVRRVIAWHQAGRDVNQLLGLLSTYLGHVSVESTQLYLQPTLELLDTAGRRFEGACAAVVRQRKARK